MPSESPKATSLRTRVALDGIAEHDDQVALGLQLVAQGFDAGDSPPFCDANAGDGLIVFANRTRRHRINVRVVMAEIGPRLEREERMLLREIGADHQHRLGGVEIAGGRQRVGLAGERVEQRRQIAGAVMIDILRAQALPRELRQEEILFVSGVIRADHAELPAARLDFAELAGDDFERLRPGDRLELVSRIRIIGDCRRSGCSTKSKA